MLETDDQVIRALRARILVDAVLDLELVDARGLLVAAPARAQPRVVAEFVEQVEARAELLIRVLDVGLLVPAQTQFGGESRRHLHARREVRGDVIAVG